MSESILFVDDEPQILSVFERVFRPEFTLSVAVGAEKGLQQLQQAGPFAVVVADQRMPGMDGIQFLAAVRDKSPDSVRIMLTGNADLEATIRLVNETGIFRFLTKPCPTAVLSKALQDALAQHRLVVAERELLNRTLRGSIKVLTDLITMVVPDTGGHGARLLSRIDVLARRLSLTNAWELHLAAMLAPIGLITIPPEVTVKVRQGHFLTAVERDIVDRVPEISRDLLVKIPRLKDVARIIYYHCQCYDGSSFPPDRVSGTNLPAGSRVLKILNDMAEIEALGHGPAEALRIMRGREEWYDPGILDAACDCFGQEIVRTENPRTSFVTVGVDQLCLGHVLRSRLETTDGQTVLNAGQVITEPILEQVRNFARLGTIQLPIQVEEERSADEFNG
jgi:response regulator RpfG family c-di-GMP phosphodiesterase